MNDLPIRGQRKKILQYSNRQGSRKKHKVEMNSAIAKAVFSVRAASDWFPHQSLCAPVGESFQG